MAVGKQLAVRIFPDAETDLTSLENGTARFDDVQYLLAWRYPFGLLDALPNLKLIISAGAGVDHVLLDPDLPDHIPLVRFVDRHLTTRMTSYVASQVLFHTRRLTEVLEHQRNAQWLYVCDPLPETVRVGVMGLGELGQASASTLVSLGFQMRGWSRSPKTIDGITCFSGDDGLVPFLAETDILVVLLPLTPQTKHMLNRDLFSQLSCTGRSAYLPGPVLINAARGGLQNVPDILTSLNDGTLYAASLDVFENEPLSAEHPLWSHPRVVVSPHIASVTSPHRIARYALKQISTFEAGGTLEHTVDRMRGY